MSFLGTSKVGENQCMEKKEELCENNANFDMQCWPGSTIYIQLPSNLRQLISCSYSPDSKTNKLRL